MSAFSVCVTHIYHLIHRLHHLHIIERDMGGAFFSFRAARNKIARSDMNSSTALIVFPRVENVTSNISYCVFLINHLHVPYRGKEKISHRGLLFSLEVRPRGSVISYRVFWQCCFKFCCICNIFCFKFEWRTYCISFFDFRLLALWKKNCFTYCFTYNILRAERLNILFLSKLWTKLLGDLDYIFQVLKCRNLIFIVV